MNHEDFIGEPCGCGPCVQWGVNDRPIRRDPRSGSWLHGRDLLRWYEAQATFHAGVRALVASKEMP